MVIGLLKEPSFETRTAFLPEHIVILKKMNVTVLVEAGAGVHSFATDEKYTEAGASIKNRNEVLQQSDLPNLGIGTQLLPIRPWRNYTGIFSIYVRRLEIFATKKSRNSSV